MELKYALDEAQKAALGLKETEKIAYAVPFDLVHEQGTEKSWLVVTGDRLIVMERENASEPWKCRQWFLADCQEVKCEHQVHCGIVTVCRNGQWELVCRFSMRHITRISYVARGADLIAKGEPGTVQSHEYERYCPRCGRAMPGTSKCPHCDGKRVMLRKFWDLCQGYQWKLLAISLLMVVSSLMSIGMPLVQQRFIDNVLVDKSGDMQDVVAFILTLLGMTVILISVNALRDWWCSKLGAMISLSLRRRLYNKIQMLSMSFINKRKPGALMNRVASDTRQIRQFMEEVFGGMVSTLVTMAGALIFMLILSWKMTLYSTVLIVAVFALTKIFWHHIHKIFHMQWIKDDKMRSGLQDVISGMRVVKAFGREQYETERFAGLTDEFARVQKKNEVFWAIFYPILTFIMGIGSYVAIYFGGLDVLDGTMTTGELVQFVTYTGFLYGPLGWMTHLPRSVMQMFTSLNRIYDVLDEEPEIQNIEEPKEFRIHGDIRFDDISFGYNSYEPVLEHMTLDVKQGEMIGLVGASGTGKSTLINLIMRLFDVDRGMISIDGINIKDISKESLHGQIGVVLQETFLFSGSILNNIRFARPDASMEEIIRAAKAANAHDFICKTPDGYNTYVGEHGYNLSGGERQRIAIARAILNDPRLLILDEATSALDTESEYLIQQALERLTAGRTTFAIAHRLSTLRNADRIVVIDGHHIAEVGSHNELLERKGIYYGLVQAQLEMAKIAE